MHIDGGDAGGHERPQLLERVVEARVQGDVVRGDARLEIIGKVRGLAERAGDGDGEAEYQRHRGGGEFHGARSLALLSL